MDSTGPGYVFEDPQDAETYARRAGRKGAPPPSSAPSDADLFFVRDAEAWAEVDLEPRPWIAPGYLLRRSVSAVIGAGAAGKSSLLVAWSVALALGRELGALRPARAMRVLTVNYEDDADEQRRRFSAALRSFGCTEAEIAGQVLRVSPKRNAPLFGQDEAGEVVTLPAGLALRAIVQEFEPDVLILDPLVEMHTVDENANTEMRAVIAGLRTWAHDRQMAVLVAHHTRKGALMPGDIDSSRGASAMKDAARCAMTLTVMDEDTAKAFNIALDRRSWFFRLDDAKSNYAPIGAAQWFERVVHTLDNGDHVAAVVPWTPPVDVVTPDVRASIEAGLARGMGEAPWSPKLDSSARSFKALCTAFGIATSLGQRALLDELLGVGGYRVEAFKRATSYTKAQGIRCPDGSPKSVAWIESTGNDQCPG